MGDFAAFLKALFPPDPATDAVAAGAMPASVSSASGQNSPTASARPATGTVDPPDTSRVGSELPWTPDAPTPERQPVFVTGAGVAEPMKPQRLVDSGEPHWRTDWRDNWWKDRSAIRREELSEPWRKWYEERAAIREYDGGQARDEAERDALREVLAAMTANGQAVSVN